MPIRPFGLGMLLAACACAAAWAQPPSPQSTALHWLGLVDAGDDEGSWRAADPLLRARISEPAWSSELGPLRREMGEAQSRTLTGQETARTLPGAPDGDYEVLRFDTAFAHKRSAVETVVLRREPWGWMVSGYFIR